MINWEFWFWIGWIELGWTLYIFWLGLKIGERETKYKFGLSTKKERKK